MFVLGIISQSQKTENGKNGQKLKKNQFFGKNLAEIPKLAIN